MLDIGFIRENTEVVKTAAKNKNVEVDIDKLLTLDEQRRSLSTKADSLRRQRNELSDTKQKPSVEDIETVKKIKAELSRLDEQLNKIEPAYKQLLYKVPNVISKNTPIGKDETANKVLRKWGKPPRFDFKPKPHWEIGRQLDVIDAERATKIAGSRFNFLKGRLVLLQFALIQFALDLLTDESKLEQVIANAKIQAIAKPFTPILAPDMIKPEVFARTGRLDPAEDKYYLEKDNLYLAGSAEQSIAPLHMDEVLSEADLPLRYVGYSTAFRREAGSYGKDTRGMIRVHQFDKLEMQTVATPAQSQAEYQLYIAIQEHLMQALELPYQVVAISSGDMGKPDYEQVDIEAWFAGQNTYRETHTADNNTDFQARRLNVQFKDKNDKKHLTHMHDATALSMRPLIAILENNQTKDGKVKIPKVLNKYMKGSYL